MTETPDAAHSLMAPATLAPRTPRRRSYGALDAYEASLAARDRELPHATCDFAARKGGCAARGMPRRPTDTRAAPALVRRFRQGHAAVPRHPPHITAAACAQSAHSPTLPDQ